MLEKHLYVDAWEPCGDRIGTDSALRQANIGNGPAIAPGKSVPST